MTASQHAAAVYTVEGQQHTADTLTAAITAADTDGADRITVIARHTANDQGISYTLAFPRRNLVHGSMDGWTLDGQEYAGWEATIDQAAQAAAELIAADLDNPEPRPEPDQPEMTALAVGLPLYPGWGNWINADLIATLVTVTAGNRYAVMAQAAAPDSNGQPVQWALTPPLDSHDEATDAMNEIARQLTTGIDWPDKPTPRKL